MMKKTKPILFFFLVTTLLIGITSATELEDNTTDTNHIIKDKTLTETQSITDKTNDKIMTKLSVEKINNTQYTKNTHITGRYVDVNGKKLKNTTIRLKINSKQYMTKTDKNGRYHLNYRANTPGINNITISYPGNSRYHGASITDTFHVTSKDTKIKLDKTADTYYKSVTNIRGYYVDSDKRILRNTRLSIRVNNEKYATKTDKNGYFNYRYKAKKVGVNNVTVSYKGNTKYSPTSTTTTFKVKANPTRIIIDRTQDTTYKKNMIISGKYVDVNNKALINTRIRLNINNKNYTVKTDENGKFKREIKANTVGKNNVTLYYPGNPNYTEAKNVTSFNVNPMKTKITFNILDKNIHAADYIEIKGKFTDELGHGLKNTLLNMTFDDFQYSYYKVTDDNGEFDTFLNVESPGLRTLTLSFKGNEKYSATMANKTFSADKMRTGISTVPSDAFKVGEDATIKGELHAVESEGYYTYRDLSNKPITITINDKETIKTTTDTNNRFVVKYKTGITGVNNVTVKYMGDENTIKSTSNKTFFVYNQTEKFLSIPFEEVGTVDKGYEQYHMFIEYLNETHYRSSIMVFGPESCPVNKIIEAKYYLKNDQGKTITKIASKEGLNDYEIEYEISYTPYKIDLTLTELNDDERKQYDTEWY